MNLDRTLHRFFQNGMLNDPRRTRDLLATVHIVNDEDEMTKRNTRLLD